MIKMNCKTKIGSTKHFIISITSKQSVLGKWSPVAGSCASGARDGRVPRKRTSGAESARGYVVARRPPPTAEPRRQTLGGAASARKRTAFDASPTRYFKILTRIFKFVRLDIV